MGTRLAPWSMAAAVVVGALIGLVVEVVLIRPLYRHHIQQVLVTVGLSLAAVAAVQGIWGSDPHPLEKPAWLAATTEVAGAQLPNDRFLSTSPSQALLFAGLLALLRFTRLGLVIRAGVENRTMVEALGINVQRTFTVVFAIGGAAAGLAGLLGGVYASSVSPGQGGALLIFAFIVVVIGGMGSLTGTAVAAVAVGLVQQLANYYAASGVGDLSVVLLLAVVLLLDRQPCKEPTDAQTPAVPRAPRAAARAGVPALRPGRAARASCRAASTDRDRCSCSPSASPWPASP